MSEERKMRMTLEDLKAMKCEYITPAVVGGILGCHPYSITLQARQDPARLGFPVCVIGTRTKIPRRAFVQFLEGSKAQSEVRGG